MESKLLTRRIPRTRKWRHPTAFEEVLTNAAVAHIVDMTRRGYSPNYIEHQLNGDVSAATIRALLREWGIEPAGRKGGCYGLVVPLNERQRSIQEQRAMALGLGVEERAKQILVCAANPNGSDLYHDIVLDPGAFE